MSAAAQQIDSVARHGGDIFGVARRQGWDWREVLDFSANINPLGMPGSVRQAINAAWGRISHYPEIGSPGLREAAAKAWGVELEQVLAGNGATELLYFLARVFRRAKVHLVEPGFGENRRAFHEAEISSTTCGPENGYALDFARLERDLAQSQPDWLVVTNPSNPTGVAADAAELADFIATCAPPHTRVLVDESFVEFAPRFSLAPWLGRLPRLVLLRSLTKFYAVPGLRAGSLLADSETIAELESLREPWQLNALAEQGMIAALGDEDYRRESIEMVQREREWLSEQLGVLAWLRPAQGVANYVFAESERTVEALQQHLLSEKILIRDCAGIPGVRGEALRVAVRTRGENEKLLRAIEAWR